MSNALEFRCSVVNGRLPEKDARQIGEAIRLFNGKRILLSIEPAKKTRSSQQNRYYWSVVVELIWEVFREAGNMVDKDDVHNFLKAEVGKLSQVLVTVEGEVFRGPGSTRKLTTAEFSNYIEAIRAWAADMLDLKIPSPDEAIGSTY